MAYSYEITLEFYDEERNILEKYSVDSYKFECVNKGFKVPEKSFKLKIEGHGSCEGMCSFNKVIKCDTLLCKIKHSFM
jgi:hypothetical protein